GFGGDPADRTAFPLHDADPFGGAGERVLAEVHRCGAGMSGPAGEADFEAALPDDSFDHADWQIEALEHGALLDVELQVAADVRGHSGARNLGRVEAKLPDGFEHLGVRDRVTYQRAATDEGDAETDAFLFAEGDDFEWAASKRGERDAHHHAEGA